MVPGRQRFRLDLCQVVSRIRTLHADYGMLWYYMEVDCFLLLDVCKSALVADNSLRYKVWLGLDSNRRWLRANRFLVRFDPVGRDLALSGLEVQFAGADELVELSLKRIFH